MNLEEIKILVLRIVSIHEKKLRFVIVGGINTVVGLSAYPLLFIALSPIGFGYIQILFISQIPCITFSFVTNKYFVFKTKGNLKKEYIKFSVFYMLIFIINLIFLPILVEILRINPIISQTLFVALIMVTSFFWHNLITFKSI